MTKSHALGIRITCIMLILEILSFSQHNLQLILLEHMQIQKRPLMLHGHDQQVL